MLQTKLLRFLSSPQYFRPSFALNFNPEGKLLLYTTPSAATFLRIFAPINIGFILVHGYFSAIEYKFPLIPGNNSYLIMTSSLTVVGLVLAVWTEIFARKFVKNVCLLSDGKTISVNFHNAFGFGSPEIKVGIEDCLGIEEVYNRNFKLTLKSGKKIFMNMDRNEVKDENVLVILQKVMNGQYINTIGDKNINKLLKKINY